MSKSKVFTVMLFWFTMMVVFVVFVVFTTRVWLVEFPVLLFVPLDPLLASPINGSCTVVLPKANIFTI